MAKLICLMPTYNKEDTLVKAIESVMMQKADFEYKLFILDDCSTDSSNKIAQIYKEKYPGKIEIFRNEKNLKLLRTIMKGYKLLKGADYFCVLDADDWYIYDKKFADAVEFLDNNLTYSMYMTNIIQKSEDSQIKCYKGKKQNINFSFSNRKKGIYLFMQTSGVVYRNLYFKNGYNQNFENVLNYKFPQYFDSDGFRFEWYLRGGNAHFVNKVESVYNYNGKGIWSSLNVAEQFLEVANMMWCCSEFFLDEKKFYMNYARLLYFLSIKRQEKIKKNKETVDYLRLVLYNNKDIGFFVKLKNIINYIYMITIQRGMRYIFIHGF